MRLAIPIVSLSLLMAVGCTTTGSTTKMTRFAANQNSPAVQADPSVDAPPNRSTKSEVALAANNASGEAISPTHAVHFADKQQDTPAVVYAGCRSCRAAGRRIGSAACNECQACAQECVLPDGRCYREQEYLFDGGDTNPAVVVKKDWSAVGIDATDTVAYYETEGGTVCVIPSNRVPIYAPRFGAVRQVTGAQLAARAAGPINMLQPVGPVKVEATDIAGNVVLPVGPRGQAQVNLIDAFQENRRGVPIAQILPPVGVSEARVPHVLLDFFRTGVLVDQDIPAVARILAGAVTLFSPEAIEVIVDGQEAVVASDAKMPKELVVYDIPDGCSLRICKVASHTIANSGDVIRFTIRFDNIGVKPISNVVIHDSLTPRLEYIQESQQCSLDAQFASVPNEVGSSTLRWEFSSIPAGEGGVISFDCRVR